MLGLDDNYIGCPVLVYDTKGQHLATDIIFLYDKIEQHLKTENDLPTLLKIGSECKLLVLAPAMPREFHGRVMRKGKDIYFALYKGRDKEDRKSKRYAATAPIDIQSYICDGISYNLCGPLKATLINISRSGLRFQSAFYTLSDGDIFQLSIKVGNNNKTFVAEVINHLDNKDDNSSIYGCRFIKRGEGGEEDS